MELYLLIVAGKLFLYNLESNRGSEMQKQVFAETFHFVQGSSGQFPLRYDRIIYTLADRA